MCIRDRLDAFESENQSGSSEKKAEITECIVKDGTAKLLITFPDAEEYLRFAAEYPDEESGVQVKALSILSMEEAELGDVSLTAAAGKEKGDIRQEKCAGFHPKGCVKRLNHVKSK